MEKVVELGEAPIVALLTAHQGCSSTATSGGSGGMPSPSMVAAVGAAKELLSWLRIAGLVDKFNFGFGGDIGGGNMGRKDARGKSPYDQNARSGVDAPPMQLPGNIKALRSLLIIGSVN